MSVDKSTENVPLTAKRQEGTVIFEAVTPENLSKRQRKEFNNNKAIVEVQLFDNDYIDRVNAMPISDEIKEKDEISIIRSTFGKLFNALTVK